MSTAERLALALEALANAVHEGRLVADSTASEGYITSVVEVAERELAAYRSTPADGGGQGVTPLTDAEIKTVAERCPMKPWGIGSRWPDALAFARAIESAHRIGTPASTGGERKEPPLNGRCQADRDGDCVHSQCPQLRDGEPKATGRHCPLDTEDDDD